MIACVACAEVAEPGVVAPEVPVAAMQVGEGELGVLVDDAGAQAGLVVRFAMADGQVAEVRTDAQGFAKYAVAGPTTVTVETPMSFVTRGVMQAASQYTIAAAQPGEVLRFGQRAQEVPRGGAERRELILPIGGDASTVTVATSCYGVYVAHRISPTQVRANIAFERSCTEMDLVAYAGDDVMYWYGIVVPAEGKLEVPSSATGLMDVRELALAGERPSQIRLQPVRAQLWDQAWQAWSGEGYLPGSLGTQALWVHARYGQAPGAVRDVYQQAAGELATLAKVPTVTSLGRLQGTKVRWQERGGGTAAVVMLATATERVWLPYQAAGEIDVPAAVWLHGEIQVTLLGGDISYDSMRPSLFDALAPEAMLRRGVGYATSTYQAEIKVD